MHHQRGLCGQRGGLVQSSLGCMLPAALRAERGLCRRWRTLTVDPAVLALPPSAMGMCGNKPLPMLPGLPDMLVPLAEALPKLL